MVTKRGEAHPLELKYEFAAFLLDPDPTKGTIADWGRAHGVTPQTLSDWKHDKEVVQVLQRWREMYEPVWAQSVAALASAATDRDHPQFVQSVRTLAELMAKFPDKKIGIDIRVSVAQLLGEAMAVNPEDTIAEYERREIIPIEAKNGR